MQAIGDADRTLEWLHHAHADQDWGLAHLGVEPQFDSVRADPRFAELLRRLGLSP